MLTRHNKRQRAEQDLLPILSIIASNGWFQWHNKNEDGSKDHDVLRSVSKGFKQLFDQPANGGPDFHKIINLLNDRNRFDMLDEGYCHHCLEHCDEEEKEEFRCETCAIYKGEWHESCSCEKNHRFEPVLLAMDPRLNPKKFEKMTPRQRAGKLLYFHQWCISNFVSRFTDGDLTETDTRMIRWPGMKGFCPEMFEHNPKVYNFYHNLLFTGWAHKSLSLSSIPPGTYDPYRPSFLKPLDEGEWHGGIRETFHEIATSFVECPKPGPGEKPLGTEDWNRSLGSELTLSQVQFLPETIRRCIQNTNDTEAVELLGKRLASTIDMYQPAVATLAKYEDTGELNIKWMPGLGMSKEEYVPLTSYEGYIAQSDHIMCTGLQLVQEPDLPEVNDDDSDSSV